MRLKQLWLRMAAAATETQPPVGYVGGLACPFYLSLSPAFPVALTCRLPRWCAAGGCLRSCWEAPWAASCRSLSDTRWTRSRCACKASRAAPSTRAPLIASARPSVRRYPSPSPVPQFLRHAPRDLFWHGTVTVSEWVHGVQGFLGLYKGVGPPLLMVGILNGFMFSVNGQMKRLVAWTVNKEKPSQLNTPEVRRNASVLSWQRALSGRGHSAVRAFPVCPDRWCARRCSPPRSTALCWLPWSLSRWALQPGPAGTCHLFAQPNADALGGGGLLPTVEHLAVPERQRNQSLPGPH